MVPWPKLYISIVNYNAERFLPDCLLTLHAAMSAYAAQHRQPVFATIVDNASTDASFDAVSPYLTQTPMVTVEWLATGANLGYGGGANFGWARLQRAHGSDAAYIVLNPDMTFQPDFLIELVRPLVEKPFVGLTGARLLFPPDAEGVVRVQHAGGYFDPTTLAAQHRGYNLPNGTDPQHDQAGPVEFLTGAALALRSDVYDALLHDSQGTVFAAFPPNAAAEHVLAITEAEGATGPFDVRFFPGYAEDVDLCWRAQAAGYSLWYAPAAIATHYEGGSFARGPSYYRLYGTNRLRLFVKHWPTARMLSEFLPTEAARLHLPRDPQERKATAALYRALAQAVLQQE